MASLNSSLKIILQFDKSLRMDFVHDLILNIFQLFDIFSSSLRLVRWHLEILLLLEDRFQRATQNTAQFPLSWSDRPSCDL